MQFIIQQRTMIVDIHLEKALFDCVLINIELRRAKKSSSKQMPFTIREVRLIQEKIYL